MRVKSLQLHDLPEYRVALSPEVTVYPSQNPAYFSNPYSSPYPPPELSLASMVVSLPRGGHMMSYITVGG